MKKTVVFLIVGFSLLMLATIAFGAGDMKTESFAFEFEGKKLNGLLDLPTARQPTAIVVLIHGYGRTNVVAGNWYFDLRARLTQLGLACCVWDKAGCGRSEGRFDINQLVQSSAREAITAIEELKRRGVAGSNRIGLWGVSRAGWICPLVIAEYPSVAFWISVSGPDDKDNYLHLLECNFPIEGRSKPETHRLIGEWKRGFDIMQKGGSYDEYLKATQELRQDAFYKLTSGEENQGEFLQAQKKFLSGQIAVDAESGLILHVPKFRETLRRIQCPVLAIFGEKDTLVDWRKTAALYQETIGARSNSDLTIKTFPDGNHSIQKCKTGGFREMMRGGTAFCDGYYETMLTWIEKHGFDQ